jgi:plastocyanin
MRAMGSRAFFLGGWIAALLLSSCGKLPVGPREGTADILGTVKDESGVGVAGVQIRIINTANIQDAVTDTAGSFRIHEVTPGTYDMNIYTPANYRLAGSQQSVIPFTINEGQTLRPEVAVVRSPGTAAMPGVAYVQVFDFSYLPVTLRIKPGTTVTWQNVEGTQHTVAAELNNDFRSGPLSRNQRFVHTFNAPGAYPYHCLFHEQMVGNVIVE